ncbi:MAG: hypothetical protein U0931_30695 [Vulcanimicrobiota bacterium]
MNISSAQNKVGRKAARMVADQMFGDGPSARALYQSELTLARLPQSEATGLLIDSLIKGEPEAEKVYISTPITGGNKLYDFLQAEHVHSRRELDPSDMPAYDRQVITVNCKHAHRIAEKLRRQGVCAVEPSSIQFPGWSQTLYNQNWTRVVNEVPFSKVIVCDGWELSYGCLLEVRAALDKGIPVMDEDNRPIDKATALKRISDSSNELIEKGFTLAHLSEALTAPFASLPMEA